MAVHDECVHDNAGAAKHNVADSGSRRAEDASEEGPSGGAPKLRVRVTNAASGSVRLDTRFPLDFLPGLAACVPQARMSRSWLPYI